MPNKFADAKNADSPMKTKAFKFLSLRLNENLAVHQNKNVYVNIKVLVQSCRDASPLTVAVRANSEVDNACRSPHSTNGLARHAVRQCDRLTGGR